MLCRRRRVCHYREGRVKSMKKRMGWARRPVSSGEEYLKRLGCLLIWYFPAGQTTEILADYQEYFSLEGEDKISESLERWGTPEEALQTLLAENPGARGYFYRGAALWGALLLFSVFCLFYGGGGLLFAMLLLPPSLFGLVHGWGRVQLQRRFFPRREKAGKAVFLFHALAAAAVLLLELQMQLICRYADRLPLVVWDIPIGPLLNGECVLLELLVFCLALLMLLRALTRSVGYLAGVFHALGALAFIRWVQELLHSLTSPEQLGTLMLFPLFYYGLGLGFALLAAGLIKMGKRA